MSKQNYENFHVSFGQSQGSNYFHREICQINKYSVLTSFNIGSSTESIIINFSPLCITHIIYCSFYLIISEELKIKMANETYDFR